MLARNPSVIKAVEQTRFEAMSTRLVPLALKVMEETLSGPAGRARDDMARFVYKEWKEEHVSIAGPGEGGETDLSQASAGQLARMIADLEIQQAALETIAAGKAKVINPSTDVIAEADTITDDDMFG
jgi:hypothetical protein